MKFWHVVPLILGYTLWGTDGASPQTPDDPIAIVYTRYRPAEPNLQKIIKDILNKVPDKIKTLQEHIKNPPKDLPKNR